MRLSGLSPIPTVIISIAALVAVISILLISSDSSTRTTEAASTYNPTLTSKQCNDLPGGFIDAPLAGGGGACVATTAEKAPSAPQTTSTLFTVPTGDLNFASIETFISPETTVTPGCNVDLFDGGDTPDAFLDGRDFDGNGVGDGVACLPPGEKAGGLMSSATLGLANGACLSPVPVPFILYNVALPDNTNDPRASSNIWVPLAEGTSTKDLLVPDPEGGTVAEVFRGRFSNGAPITPPLELGDAVTDVIPSSSKAVQEYPDFLLDLFDPDWLPIAPPIDGPDADPGVLNTNNGPLIPLIPLAVYGSLTAPEPASSDWVALYFLVFDKGQLKAAAGDFDAPHRFDTYDATLGYATVTVLQDVSTVATSVSIISDFCTNLVSTTMLLGKTINNTGLCPIGGCVRASNPPTPGPYVSEAFTESLRDLDDDGIENVFDSCPTVATPGFDPRIQDPNGSGPDVISGGKGDSTTDPENDFIPSACDPDPDSDIPDGSPGPTQLTALCGTEFVAQNRAQDHDNDCFLNAQDNCPAARNGRVVDGAQQTPTLVWDGQKDGEAFVSYATAAPSGGPKTDGIGDACEGDDTVANGIFHSRTMTNVSCIGIPWTVPAGDQDCDGYSATIEAAIGTDPNAHCGTGAWPPDFNNTLQVDIFDVLFLAPPVFFSTAPGPPYDARLDLSPSNQIDIFDVLKMAPPVFFFTCVP